MSMYGGGGVIMYDACTGGSVVSMYGGGGVIMYDVCAGGVNMYDAYAGGNAVNMHDVCAGGSAVGWCGQPCSLHVAI